MSSVGTTGSGEFFVAGGTLPLVSESYVERDCDRALFEALRAGKYCYVLNSRQMGKSSLSIRTLVKLEQEGWTAISLDLTQMGGRNVTAEQWYLGMAVELGRAVGLRSEVLAYVRENAGHGPMRRFFGAIREVVLERIEGPLVICIDEIDATRNLAFDTDEFFAGIRECYNRRAQDPGYGRLTFCILGVAVPTDLIRSATTTPFNIGERVYLRDFSLAEARSMAHALGPNGEALVDRVHYWTNGHPFLTQSLCAAIAANVRIQTPGQVDELVKTELFGPKARDRNINLADVANRALNAGAAEPDPERFRADLLSAYGRARAGKPLPDDESNRVASLLKLSGLVRSDDMRLRVRNRIYEHVFDREWIEENMPGQELRRLQQSFRRGLIRATAIFGTVFAAMAALAIVAWRSQNRAAAATEALDRELYVAAMNNLRVFEQNGDIGRIAETLERTRQSPYRGIEWGLWQRRLHDAKEEYTLDFFAPGKRETGMLSGDGRLLCLIDEVTATATVIRRADRSVVTSQRLRAKQSIVPTATGFLQLDVAQNPPSVRNLLANEAVGALGHNSLAVTRVYSRLDSSCVALFRGLDDGETMELWDLATRRMIAEYGGRGSHFDQPVAFSSDGRRIAFSHRVDSEFVPGDNPASFRIETWDTEERRKVDEFEMPSDGSIFDLSTGGSWLLYGDGGSTTFGRSLTTHRNVYRRGWPRGEAPSAGYFSGDGDVLVTVDRTGRAIVEAFPGARLMATHQNVWNATRNLQKPELVASATSVRIVDLLADSGAPVLIEGNRFGRDEQGNFVVFQGWRSGFVRLSNPDLRPIARGTFHAGLRNFTYNGRWQTWEDPGSKQAYFGETHDAGPPRRIGFPFVNFSGGLNERTIAFHAPRTGEIVAMDGRTGVEKWRFRLPESSRSGLWVSPDGSTVFAFSGATSLLVLDAETGRLRERLDRHNVRLSNLAFTSDGKGFFTCGGDGRAILWDLVTLRERMQFQGNVARGIVCADLSPDGRRVVTGNDAGAWQLWDAETGVQLAETKVGPEPIRSVMFTSDGRKILAACDDRNIRVWSPLDYDPSVRIPLSQSRRSTIRE